MFSVGPSTCPQCLETTRLRKSQGLGQRFKRGGLVFLGIVEQRFEGQDVDLKTGVVGGNDKAVKLREEVGGILTAFRGIPKLMRGKRINRERI
jgi:hypothetical protein